MDKHMLGCEVNSWFQMKKRNKNTRSKALSSLCCGLHTKDNKSIITVEKVSLIRIVALVCKRYATIPSDYWRDWWKTEILFEQRLEVKLLFEYCPLILDYMFRE